VKKGPGRESRGFGELVARSGAGLPLGAGVLVEDAADDADLLRLARAQVPRVGALVGGDREAYTYLPQSVDRFLTPPELAIA
jgi:hypothetical protein